MSLRVNTGIRYGNACDLEVVERQGLTEVSFAPDPHGGPECLWFCFRLERDGVPKSASDEVRLVLKHAHNMLGGGDPQQMRPVVCYAEGDWQRLDAPEIVALRDGRGLVIWTVRAPESWMDVAYCFPYGQPDVDVLVHETFNTVDQLMERSGYDERTAKAIGTMIHSDPAEAAYVINKCNPKLFVAFHFFNDFDTAPEMEAAIREHWKGRLALATDFLVVNVTKDEIVTRDAIVTAHAWPNKSQHEGFGTAERKPRMPISDWLREKQVFPKF